MPIVVTCRCGKRFAAKDHLFGRQVPCPSCGDALVVGEGAHSPSDGIYVACTCGRAFVAPESMRGELARCRGCGRMIQVPGPDPLGMNPPPTGKRGIAGKGTLRPATSPPSPDEETEIPWDTLKRIGIVGGSVLLLVMVVTTIANNWHRRPTLPKPEQIAALVAAAVPKPPPVPPATDSSPPSLTNEFTGVTGESVSRGSVAADLFPSGARPMAAARDDSPQATTSFNPSAPRAIVTPGSQVSTAPTIARLPDGVQDWYAQPGARHTGTRAVDPSDPPIAHYSWLTELLPFLGHGQLYQQFDFKQPLTAGKNLQLARVLVPEFLNPLDDRRRWSGYPFDGVALTHVVGISGVEDTRNVVAAQLPRSDSRAGVFGYNEVARPEEITDGQSQTIMVAGAGAMANPWAFGGGAAIRGAREPLFDKTSGLGTKGLPAGGSMVVMADGSVRHVSANIDPRVFKAMCTIHGADSVDLEQAAPPFALHDLKRP
jgi:hypothetical protein